MKPVLLLSGLFVSLLTVTACDRVFQRPADTGETETVTADTNVETTEGAVELPVRAESTSSGAAIDWDAARRDLAARSSGDLEAGFTVQSGGDAPPVPVFLPSGPVAAQGGEVAIRFQPTSDGYYAFFPGEAYDIIVNGTNVVISTPGAVPVPRTDAYTFQPTTTGAQVAFSKYGADYLVEFECKALVADEPACVTEADALAFARGLEISGTR